MRWSRDLFGARTRGLILSAIALFLYNSGCDTAVDPFQPNDQFYSIFGYLNASADTQYIRIEALRDSLFMGSPEDLHARVVLTDLSTGRSTEFNDSLFHFPPGPAHNFYTTYDIKPLQKYRVSVEGADGSRSSATVSIPDTFPAPTTEVSAYPDSLLCSISAVNSFSIDVQIRYIDRLVSLTAIYYLRPSLKVANQRTVWKFDYLDDTLHTNQGIIESRINYGRDLCSVFTGDESQRARIKKVVVVAAAGTPEWPDLLSLDSETEKLSGVISNVEGGTGFLGGIVTDTLVLYPRFIEKATQ